MHVSLDYGDGRLEMELPDERVVGLFAGPRRAAARDVRAAVLEAARAPIDFPPLGKAVVPGDHVVLALEAGLPQAGAVVAGLVEVLLAGGVEPRDLLLLDPSSRQRHDPRLALPRDLRAEVQWELHDPDEKGKLAYLASTERGDRIYLNRRLVDADVVLPVSRLDYDPVFGYRGTTTALYPALADREPQERLARGARYTSSPSMQRPGRSESDEVGWLLGVPASVAVVPGLGEEVLEVLVGDTTAVFQRGKAALDAAWTYDVAKEGPNRESGTARIPVAAADRSRRDETPAGPPRADTVLASIGPRAASWVDLGAALAGVGRLVRPGGEMVLLSSLADSPGPACRLLSETTDPLDAAAQLRKHRAEPTLPDAFIADELAAAVAHAKVYLLSALEEELVESLSMVPLGSAQEAARLVSRTASCWIVAAAQRARILPNAALGSR